MKVLMVILSFSLSGCIFYSRWQESQQHANILEQQAAILKDYRECLERYADPHDARANCEHYTQMLATIDVRGLR